MKLDLDVYNKNTLGNDGLPLLAKIDDISGTIIDDALRGVVNLHISKSEAIKLMTKFLYWHMNEYCGEEWGDADIRVNIKGRGYVAVDRIYFGKKNTIDYARAKPEHYCDMLSATVGRYVTFVNGN